MTFITTKHAVLQMPWPTWPWSPWQTSLALHISPSLASMGSGALPMLIWTSRETTKSSFYPNILILKCTKGEIRWWRLENFETLSILASSTVNPHRKFPRRKKSRWSTTLTEVREFPHYTIKVVMHLIYAVVYSFFPHSQFCPGSSYIDC